MSRYVFAGYWLDGYAEGEQPAPVDDVVVSKGWLSEEQVRKLEDGRRAAWAEAKAEADAEAERLAAVFDGPQDEPAPVDEKPITPKPLRVKVARKIEQPKPFDVSGMIERLSRVESDLVAREAAIAAAHDEDAALLLLLT